MMTTPKATLPTTRTLLDTAAWKWQLDPVHKQDCNTSSFDVSRDDVQCLGLSYSTLSQFQALLPRLESSFLPLQVPLEACQRELRRSELAMVVVVMVVVNDGTRGVLLWWWWGRWGRL